MLCSGRNAPRRHGTARYGGRRPVWPLSTGTFLSQDAVLRTEPTSPVCLGHSEPSRRRALGRGRREGRSRECLLRGWTPPPVGTLPEQRLRAAVGATSFVHTRVGQLPPGSAGRAPAWAARAAGEGRPARGASLLGCSGARPSPRADGQMSAACQGLAKEDGVTARTTAETLPSA